MNVFGKHPGLRLVMLRLVAIIITVVTAMAFMSVLYVLWFGSPWLSHSPVHAPQSAIWVYHGVAILALIFTMFMLVRRLDQQHQLDMLMSFLMESGWNWAYALLFTLAMVAVIALAG